MKSVLRRTASIALYLGSGVVSLGSSRSSESAAFSESCLGVVGGAERFFFHGLDLSVDESLFDS